MIREAVTLPLILLTVTLCGGFRSVATSGEFRFLAPPLVHLVLALLVVAVLVRSGILQPEALVSARRSGIENATGTVVILALFVASAQVLNAVTPDTGLFHLLFVIVLAMQLGNTLAIRPDADRAVQGLLVTLGGLLLVTHVLLAALADPQRGFARRVLTALLEGVTLGELRLEPAAPATGYVAFITLLLYFAALLILRRLAFSGVAARSAALVADGEHPSTLTR